MRRSLPLLVILFLVFGCSSDRKAPTSAPPPPENEVSPPVRLGGGSPVGGEAVQASAANVRNSPPEIRGVQFVGGDGRPGNTLGVEAEGHDADGDPVQFEIAWQKNGQPAGVGNRLTASVKRGDKVNVTLTPFDGKDRGISAMLSREILNTPPAIEGQEQFQVSDNAVTFHVRASDADGDPLTYALRETPPGMSIDRGTGWVRWVTSPGTTGKVPFTVVVSDGSGGESTARITVTIAGPPPSGAR
ncbi:MAG: Ig-like domain-containing protein [Candidatus Deferrimicrobiaceae bacterium]